MSLLSPKTRLNKEQRLQIITENILTHSYEQLAKLCRCTKRTIKRDVQEWKRTGRWQDWILDQFFKVYAKVEPENPDKALDKLVYLMGKGMTTKQEIRTEMSGQLDITQKLDELIKLTDDEE